MMANNKSINMTIAGKILADRFAIQTYDNAEIDQLFTVGMKGDSYTFKASEISSNNSLNSVTGTYDIDDILNKGIHNLFDPPIKATDVRAINTMQELAGVLGKTLNINITDFYPADFPTTPTGKELISALFGWADEIPQRQINVFIRGNTINVLERGRETETAEVVNYANVTINRKKIRTLQDPLDVAGIEITGALVGKSPQQDAPTPSNYISGIFTNGDTSITYTNGLVTKESHTVKGVEEVTTYSYSSSMPPAYLTSKKTITTTTTGTPPVTAEGAINVAYSYNNEKLVKEVEENYAGDTLDMKRITRHYPIGQGMWGTSVEEDDVTTYGGISQGAPGGKSSAYSIAKESASPSTPERNQEPPIYILPGKPYTKYLGTMPVTDSASIARIANDIIWLDKKTEVRVTLDAYANAIFDLSKRILWQGDEYFLESNNVNVDPDKTLQRLEMVRWA